MVKNNFRFSIGLPSNLVTFGVRNICAKLFAYIMMFNNSSRHAKFCKMKQTALFTLKSLVILILTEFINIFEYFTLYLMSHYSMQDIRYQDISSQLHSFSSTELS